MFDAIDTDKMMETLMSRKGQITTMITFRPCKVKKGQEPIFKMSKFQCRVGVTYDNMKAVQEGRANGELPAENAGLPWGEWESFPHVIRHKGERYFRCTSLNNGYRKAPRFYRDGQIITKDEAQAACLASEFRGDDETPLVFTVKVSSILEVK